MSYPEISDKPEITFEEACNEYRYLKGLREQKTGFPGSGSGWSRGVLHQIENRLEFVKHLICETVTKECE